MNSTRLFDHNPTKETSNAHIAFMSTRRNSVGSFEHNPNTVETNVYTTSKMTRYNSVGSFDHNLTNELAKLTIHLLRHE